MVAIGILKNNVFPLFFNLFGIPSTLRVFRMSRLKTTTLNSLKSATERLPRGALFAPIDFGKAIPPNGKTVQDWRRIL